MQHKLISLLLISLVFMSAGLPSNLGFSAQGCTSIRFVRARVVNEVLSHIPQLQKSEMVKAADREQYVLIEIEANEPTEMPFSSFVLRGSLNKIYVPSGVAPYSIDRWCHFFPKSDTDSSWAGIETIEFGAADGTKVKYDLSKLILSAKAKVGLCFVTSDADKSLTLSIGGAKPVSIDHDR